MIHFISCTISLNVAICMCSVLMVGSLNHAGLKNNVCFCVFVYVCNVMYVRMYVRTYVSMCVCKPYVCMRVCMYACMYVCM